MIGIWLSRDLLLAFWSIGHFSSNRHCSVLRGPVSHLKRGINLLISDQRATIPTTITLF